MTARRQALLDEPRDELLNAMGPWSGVGCDDPAEIADALMNFSIPSDN